MNDRHDLFGTESDRLDRLVSRALEQPAPGNQVVSPVSLEMLLEESGRRIGRYELLHVLGEGGMGVVYRAQQDQPVKRQVALKIIKPGMDSKRVIARFEAEKQALALLDHPNMMPASKVVFFHKSLFRNSLHGFCLDRPRVHVMM